MGEYAGYLFVHFTGEHRDGEQIYFSLSKDGLHWNDLNNGELVLRSQIGEAGARDPFVIRSPWGGKYWIIATDLRIEAGKGWDVAQHSGSRDILIWESEDLVNWDGPRAVTVGVEGAGCVWAPEAIYDEERDLIMIFFASMTDGKQKIYRCFTKDFRSFTDTELYTECDNHIIDSTIIRADGGYYRYTKDETTKRIKAEFGKNLENISFSPIHSSTLESMVGVEGPEIFKLNDSDKYCLIVDRYSEGKGYLPMLSNDLSTGEFTVLEDDEFDFGITKKRHGGVMPVTESEYERIKTL